MKRSYPLLAIILLGFVLQGYGQATGTDFKLLRFYEQLAVRDAAHEQSLSLGHQDELDYWIDQENYERQLGKSNFTFYLVYMKTKKEAHRKYLRECNGLCNLSEVYLDKVRNYVSIPDSTDIFNANTGKVVLSSSRRQ